MNVCVRETLHEIREIAIGEHRIIGPPQEQRRRVVKAFDAVCDRLEGSTARVPLLKWDVGHEVADRPAARGRSIRRRECLRDCARHLSRTEGRSAHPRSTANEDVGPTGVQPQQRTTARDTNDRRRRRSSRLVDRSIEEHHSAQVIAMAQGPPERDRASPVMRNSDHRPRDAKLRSQRAQVVNAIG